MSVKPILRIDSLGCIQIAKDPTQHWKLRHIYTRHRFMRQHVQNDDLRVTHLNSAVNVADVFTNFWASVSCIGIAKVLV